MTLSPPLLSMMTDDAAGRALPPLPRPPGGAGGAGDRAHAREDAALPRRSRASTSTSSRDVRRDLPRRVRLRPGARVPQAPRRGQARDHHLRRHPRVPARSWTPCPQAVRAQVQVAVAALPAALSAATPRASGCRSAATCPGHEASCRRRASASASSSRTASPTRTRGPRHGVLAPILLAGRHRVLRPRHGVVAAGLERGGRAIPGDYDYREFYKDVGWELPARVPGRRAPRRAAQERRHQVLPDHGQGRASATSSPTCREWALEKAADHAGHFLDDRQKQVARGAPAHGPAAARGEPLRRGAVRPLVVRGAGLPELPVPQDALRPGRGASRSRRREYLERHPELRGGAAAHVHLGRQGLRRGLAEPGQRLDLSATSTMAAERMVELARRFEHAEPTCERRALNQAARELLLAQSSDWAFIMKTGTTVEYAKKRTRDHIARFTYLYRALTRGRARGADPARVRGARQHLPGHRLPRLSLSGVRMHGAHRPSRRRSRGRWYPGHGRRRCAAEVERHLAAVRARRAARAASSR